MTNIDRGLYNRSSALALTGANSAFFIKAANRVRIALVAALALLAIAAVLIVATIRAEAATEMTPRDQNFQPIAIVPSALVEADAPEAGMADAGVEAEPAIVEEAIEQDLGQGEASYYGKQFAGRRTASGETFDPAQLTAAHRTLPMGSKVRVTNVRNGKSVVVRINDRGPFHGNRVIDLSRAAASEIGLVQAGRGQVKLALLD